MLNAHCDGDCVHGRDGQALMKPTADNPAQFGADEAAVLADAQTGLDNLKARSRHFANGSQLPNDVITVVNVACNVNTNDAFALLTGN